VTARCPAVGSPEKKKLTGLDNSNNIYNNNNNLMEKSFVERLTVLQLDKKFFAYYGT